VADVRTNIEIDDDLMRQAMRSSGVRTKRAVVEEGLRLFIRTRGQGSIRRLRGKVAWPRHPCMTTMSYGQARRSVCSMLGS
jgi:hypothetical protein